MIFRSWFWYEQDITNKTACQLIYPFSKNFKFKNVMFMIGFNPKSLVIREPK